ncbi:MAG: alpha/beta hydrolase [Hyphomicrobiales bacterium]|nr:alpha/beta hydrolase [Hyphomicrobiales bacterium]
MLGFLILAIAGCGHVVGVLKPVPVNAPGTSRVNMLVVTTRAPSKDPGLLYTGRRDRNYSVDEISVSIPPDSARKIGEVQWPRRLPPNPEKDFTTVAVKQIPPEAAAGRAWLRRNLPKSRKVLVFVHGFNNRYGDAVYRFAQIMHDSHADAAPILFTWPSAGKLFDYNYDRESTIYSRDGLETVLRLLAEDPQVSDVTVLAHSMGTWLTMESLRQMAIRDGRVAPKIKNVILASPDIDVDVFGRQFRDLGDRHPKFTVFVSRDDRALAVSRFVAGNVNRLGQINPEAEPYRSEAAKDGISFIDLTRLRAPGADLNHDKFAASPLIVRAIGTRLVNGQSLSESKIGLGDSITIIAAGTAKAVGTGAGLLVSTPLSVIDPATRRNLGSQADDFAGQIDAAARLDGRYRASTAADPANPTRDSR